MQPKIALAHDHLFQIGGAEKVLAVLAEIFPEAPIYTLINNPKITKNILEQKRIVASPLQKIPFIHHIFQYFLWFMPRLWEKTDLSAYDIVLSSSSGFVKGLKFDSNKKHLCYCHSPIRYLWEDREEYLGQMPEGRILSLLLPKLLNKLQIWDFSQAQKVSLFIANSENIAHKIKKYYKRDSIVITPPLDLSQFYLASEPKDYYLIVSRFRPYKKVDVAIKAFNNLKLPLKIIGTGSEKKRLKRLAQNNIEFLGEVSDEQRNYYLAHCRALIYPQEEDFGISALEAMASGRPVIAYRKGGALETVQEGVSGSFFDEQTWESLAHCILRFDQTKFSPEKIRQHVAQFDKSIFINKIKKLVAQQ